MIGLTKDRERTGTILRRPVCEPHWGGCADGVTAGRPDATGMRVLFPRAGKWGFLRHRKAIAVDECRCRVYFRF